MHALKLSFFFFFRLTSPFVAKKKKKRKRKRDEAPQRQNFALKAPVLSEDHAAAERSRAEPSREGHDTSYEFGACVFNSCSVTNAAAIEKPPPRN